MLRLQNSVPDAYIDTSRDFQLLCRLFDFTNNSIKSNTDDIKNIINTKFIPVELLDVLKTKVGFFTNKEFSERELRFALSAFPILVKNKGSRLGITQAINVWANINHYNGRFQIQIGTEEDKYKIIIKLEQEFGLTYDMTILNEILRYVLPTGYYVDYEIFRNVSIGGVSNPEAVVDTVLNKGLYYNYPYSILPDEYQEVEWIGADSTQSQWIDTGVVINEKTKIDIWATQESNASIFGTFGENNTYFYGITGSRGSARFDYQTGQETLSDISIPYYDFKKFTTLGASIKVNDVLVFETEIEWTQNTYTLPLFCRYGNVGAKSNFLTGKIKKCIITDTLSGDIICNLIPCYRKNDGVIGMYDTIENNFHINGNPEGGAFSKGNDVSTNPVSSADYNSGISSSEDIEEDENTFGGRVHHAVDTIRLDSNYVHEEEEQQ